MTDLCSMWKLLDESGGESVTYKLYRREGDARPFRLIVLVQGEEACEAMLDTMRCDAAEYESDRRAAQPKGGSDNA